MFKEKKITTLGMNEGGLFEDPKGRTYDKNMFYINSSGFMTRLPDQEMGVLEEIKQQIDADRSDLAHDFEAES